MALTKSMSSDHISMAENSAKQVRWSIDLEEVFYFTPQKPRRKSITERLRGFKEKANDYLADRTLLPKVHFINRGSRRDSTFRKYSVDLEADLNRQWDELFKLYSERVFSD